MPFRTPPIYKSILDKPAEFYEDVIYLSSLEATLYLDGQIVVRGGKEYVFRLGQDLPRLCGDGIFTNHFVGALIPKEEHK